MNKFMWVTKVVAVIALVLLSLSPTKVGAGEGDAFHSAQAGAYAHYRQALFYARRENTMSAAFELEELSEKWAKLMSQFAGNPPALYAADATWRDTLEGIAKRIDQALATAVEGDAKQAHDQLIPVREILSDLRQRNNVVIFSDHIDAANQAFQKLFQFRRNPPDFADPVQVRDLQGRLAETISAYEKCRTEASPEVAENEQFQRLIEDSLFYLKRINVAIDEKNQLSVVNILRRVVSSDNLLWMLFG